MLLTKLVVYVYWYILLFFFLSRDLSLDEEFVDELRTNIRFLASVLFRRMKKVCDVLIVVIVPVLQLVGLWFFQFF